MNYTVLVCLHPMDQDLFIHLASRRLGKVVLRVIRNLGGSVVQCSGSDPLFVILPLLSL